MNHKNEQLVKIGLDVINNCDDFFAIQKLAVACQKRLKYMAIPRQIGPLLEEDVFAMFNIDDDWSDHTITGLRYKYEWEPIAAALDVEVKKRDSMKKLAQRCRKMAIILFNGSCTSNDDRHKF